MHLMAYSATIGPILIQRYAATECSTSTHHQVGMHSLFDLQCAVTYREIALYFAFDSIECHVGCSPTPPSIDSSRCKSSRSLC